jgi:hypothetical protein
MAKIFHVSKKYITYVEIVYESIDACKHDYIMLK